MLSFTILERFAAGLPPAVSGASLARRASRTVWVFLRGVSTMAARSTRARAKPAPWKTDASADLDRFGTRPRPSKGGSRGRDSDPSDAASDRWETTSTRSFGARTLASARAADFPPEATLWTTTNADLQYDPREFVDPNWRALGVSTDRPIRERALRRSRVADPAGTGESAVGGWAGVPRTRLGGADPLGGPDRGRAGVEWGEAYHLSQSGEAMVVARTEDGPQRAGGVLERELAQAAHEAWGGDDKNKTNADAASSTERVPKKWQTRGPHPSRLRQSAGGSDVVSGLWAASSSSYGRHAGDAFKLDREAKTADFRRRLRAIAEAPVRRSVVLSNAAYNAHVLDEEESAEARRVVAEEASEERRAAGAPDPLDPLEAYKMRKAMRALQM